MGQYAAIMLILVAFSHISTIGWIIFKYPTDIEQYGENFLGAPSFYANRYRYYFHHLYFVVTTCSTIGYGDISPDKNSSSELIFGMLVELVGLSILGIMWIMSNNLLSNFSKQKARIHQNMKDFKEWFKVLERTSKAEFSRKFVEELTKFFQALYRLEIDTIVYDNQYLDDMPPKLALELEHRFLEAHKSPFEELFARYNKEMCIDIIEACEQISYVGGTKLLNRGHLSPGVFWISKGTVQCTYLQPDQTLLELEEGDSFGSFCMLGEACRCDYVTKDVCMIHFLPKDRLEQILDTFKVDSILFREEALADFKQIQNRRNALKSMLRLRRLGLTRGHDQAAATGPNAPDHRHNRRRSALRPEQAAACFGPWGRQKQARAEGSHRLQPLRTV